MQASRLRSAVLWGLLISAASCRSILDIEPGRPLEESGGSAGKASGGKGNASAGGNGDAGASEPEGGAPGSSGTGTAGSSKGGTPATAGSSSMAGENAGGNGGSPPMDPLPEGSCRDCMARNCPAETQACVGEEGCVDDIPLWLECEGPIAEECVTEEAGALQDLEACGARSCDVCRHGSDGAPAIEILTPANGAQLTANEMGRIEVSARVHNFTLKSLGACAMTDTSCGHVHFNIDEANCSINGFFNTWTFTGDAEGNVDFFVDITSCKTDIKGLPVDLRASLSANVAHGDRVPAVQSVVTVTVTE